MPPIFISPLLFKKTQIQLHSLKTTTLTINLSLFNIISVHFHRFGPPFNKGMYSLSPKPLRVSSANLVCPSASLQRRTHRLTVLTSSVASPYTFFSLSCMRMGISPSAVKNSITKRCLIRPGIHALVKRWTKTVEMDGDYIEKWQINRKFCGFQAFLKSKGEKNRRH